MDDISRPEIIVYVLGGLAIAIAGARSIALQFRHGINAHAMATQVEKLIAVDSFDRARKLCQAVGTGIVPVGLDAVLAAIQAGERDKKALRRIFEAYIARQQRELALYRLVEIITLPLALAALGYGVVHTEQVSPQAFGVPGVALLAAAFGQLRVTMVQRDARRALITALKGLGKA